MSDSLDSADYDKTDADRQDNARNDDCPRIIHAEQADCPCVVRIEEAVDGRRDPVHLGKCTDAQQAYASAEECEDLGEPAPVFAHSAFDIVKRSSENMAVFFDFTVFNRQHAFRVLSRHSEKGRDPHPEQRSGSARYESRRNPDDIPGSDCRGQGRTQRTEAGDLTVTAFFILDHILERSRELTHLKNAQTDCQEDAYRQNQYDKRHTPDEIVEPEEKIVENR